MDDVLPILLVMFGLICAMLMGIILYALSFFMDFFSAFFLVAGGASLIFGGMLYFLAPNIDNKDAVKVIKQVVIFVLAANILVFSENIIKIFAINF